MTIVLPDLDDISYESLLNRMVESIPKYSRLWTDFNYSDPGITLVQLLCWIAESLIYRANYIPIETYINFLQLLAGASGDKINALLITLEKQGLDQTYIDLLRFLKTLNPQDVSVESLQTAAITFWNAPYLAVTANDYAMLTLEANQLLDSTQASIARAIILNNQESVTVICVADQTTPSKPAELYQHNLTMAQTIYTDSSKGRYISNTDYATIIAAVEKYLAPRLLLGSITYVQQPTFTPVNVEMVLLCDALADAELISQEVISRLQDFLSPLPPGGTDGQGWIYSQTPTVAMINHEVITIPGVSYVQSLEINFYPTMKLGVMATLNVDAIVGEAPAGLTQPQFVGLAQAQILNVVVKNN